MRILDVLPPLVRSERAGKGRSGVALDRVDDSWVIDAIGRRLKILRDVGLVVERAAGTPPETRTQRCSLESPGASEPVDSTSTAPPPRRIVSRWVRPTGLCSCSR